MKTGVLLVNLGTPDSPGTADVRRYLNEFLTDGRVIDIPAIRRQLLVRGIISPFRAPKSAASYKAVWTEKGSPLMAISLQQRDLLAKELGGEYQVELAMRYQNPSIASQLEKFKGQALKELVILPLFPQYASASTGSVHQEVMRVVSKWQVIPEMRFINSFPTHTGMIQAFGELGRASARPMERAASGRSAIDSAPEERGIRSSENTTHRIPAQVMERYDHILLSFHGLPERQLIKADTHGHCLKSADCCNAWTEKNQYCYSAQCHATARALAAALGLKPGQYTVCFQSRLGKTPWRQPFTIDVIHRLAAEGKKRMLVFCPAFVADCLETIFEIGVEYRDEFLRLGGEELVLVEGLNTHPTWIRALAQICRA